LPEGWGYESLLVTLTVYDDRFIVFIKKDGGLSISRTGQRKPQLCNIPIA
jgi:hypothetical protein